MKLPILILTVALLASPACGQAPVGETPSAPAVEAPQAPAAPAPEAATPAPSLESVLDDAASIEQLRSLIVA